MVKVRNEPGLASIESTMTGKGIYAYSNGRNICLRRLLDGKFHDLDRSDFLVDDVRKFAFALIGVCDAAERGESVDSTTLPEWSFKKV